MTEYRALELSNYDSEITSSAVKELNEWFAEGWEYVEEISQHVAIAGDGYKNKAFGPVIVIIKRTKLEL